MDLNSIDISLCETGSDMIVQDIDGNDTDATITLLGSESKVGRKLMLDFMRSIKDDKTHENYFSNFCVDNVIKRQSLLLFL